MHLIPESSHVETIMGVTSCKTLEVAASHLLQWIFCFVSFSSLQCSQRELENVFQALNIKCLIENLDLTTLRQAV